MEDTYRHKGLRKQLIEKLRRKDGLSKEVLEAMSRIPRHLFLDKAFEEWAYKDVPFPIGCDQTISQPYTVAYQSTMLAVEPGMKVLEIGTGSGYQACVLAEMGAKVYTIERVEMLYTRTSKLFKELGYDRIRNFHRDGTEGLPRFAPFDRILVTAAATEVPGHLLQQIAVGGIMVIPVGTDDQQSMYRISRKSEDDYKTEKFGAFRFVPIVKGVRKE